MSRDGQDPYTYAGTPVLINRLGVRDVDVLRRAEYDLTAARTAELLVKPIEGRFGLRHLQTIHKHIFQDVYDWAGELRRVNMSKDGSRFASAAVLQSYGDKVFADLAADRHLKGLEKPEFVGRLAHHFAEVNALHPFREGNGRATQVFFVQVARQAGHELDFTKVDKERWNEAARQSFLGKLEPMRAVFHDVASPARAVAFEKLPRESALKAHPELAQAYQRLDLFRTQVADFDPQTKERAEAAARAALSKALRAGELTTGAKSKAVQQEKVNRGGHER